MSNVKNYREQGSDNWVISGTLEVTTDGRITISGVRITRTALQADSTAATVEELKTDFNALLAKLKTAGLMVAE